MSHCYNERKKNIKRFKKDPTNANPKFTKKDGQWKVVPETLAKEVSNV